MKRTKVQPLKKLLDEWMQESKIAPKIYEARVMTAWYDILGPLASSTERLFINNKVLFVSLSSSVVRNELYMQKSKIITALNSKAGGEEIITDIVFK
ncbi:MAG: DUF721 domain-containing protein [Tannerella sp.]|jgi:predicted nucleic acid-binding Zn ribbon protein|nr:DUF721 domain-containing protein [Tannerella sp.]